MTRRRRTPDPSEQSGGHGFGGFLRSLLAGVPWSEREETEEKRETAGTFYVVIEGSGVTEVGGKRFEWGKNDIFVVPNFLWRRHVNAGKGDAVIYSVSDAALMRNIGQYYAQGRSNDGKVTELAH